MAHVHRVGGPSAVRYFNSAREAGRFKPGGDEPESIGRLDAAGECNRLEEAAEAADRRAARARLLLSDLWDACDLAEGTDIGRRVLAFLEADPPPPATAADRDGDRSYGR